MKFRRLPCRPRFRTGGYIGELGPVVEELLDVGVENALTVLPLADAFGQLLAKLVGLAGVGVLVDKSIQVGPYEVRLEKREVIVCVCNYS